MVELKELKASNPELADAVEAVLAGKSPPLAETPTFGCPLPKRSQKSEIGNQK